MNGHVISPTTYAAVLTALLLLTVLTVGVSFIPLEPPIWHVVMGLIIAVAKASLVVLFFMHVLHSPRLTALVVIAAVFWLGILLVLTLGDYFTRGMLPIPGH